MGPRGCANVSAVRNEACWVPRFWRVRVKGVDAEVAASASSAQGSGLVVCVCASVGSARCVENICGVLGSAHVYAG